MNTHAQRIRNIAASLLVLATTAGLVACDGGGSNGGASGTLSTTDFLPLTEGNRWVYQVTEAIADDTPFTVEEVIEINGTRTVAGIGTLVQQAYNPVNGELRGQSFLHKTEDALAEYFEPGNTPFGVPVESITLQALPLTTGNSFVAHEWTDVDVGADYDGDSLNDALDARMTVTVAGIEAVTVPAGSFPLARKVTTEFVETYTFTRDNSTRLVVTRTEEWLAAGIGVVKRVRTTTFPTYVKTATHALTGYRIGDARNESIGPQVTQAQPLPADGNQQAWPDIGFDFNETLDIKRADDIVFTLTSDSGESAHGIPALQSQRLEFGLTRPLAPGTYTATLRGVFDLLGNELPTYTREFTVSASNGDLFRHQPMALNNRWIFDVTRQVQGEAATTFQVMETLAGKETIDGVDTLVFEVRDPATNEFLGDANVMKTDAAIHQVFTRDSMPPGEPDNMPVLLRLPIEENDYYQTYEALGVDIGVDYDDDGVNESVDLHTTVSTGATFELISVHGRFFSYVLKATTTYKKTLMFSGNGATLDYQTSTTEWMAPEIGTVKRLRTESGPDFYITTTYLLRDYRVGPAYSDSTAPYVVSTTPATSGTNQVPEDIVVNFSEPLAAGTVTQDDFVVSDVLGPRVAGSIAVTGSQLRFVPEQPLTEGTYRVTVVAAEDILGNTLGNLTWYFTVDLTPPAVVSTSLRDGATGIMTYADIRINFSESLQYGAYGPPNVLLSANGVNIPYQDAVVSGKQLVLKAGRLEHGTRYTVTLGNGIRDTYGNPLPADYSFSFTTLPALFEATATIDTGATVVASAIGDVNSDGRKDVVMVTSSSSYLSDLDMNTLFVFRQNADGTLAEPEKFKTIDGNGCSPSAVQVGDVTGDGATDIVVGESGCGFKVYQRTPAGDWPRPPRITTTDSRQMRLADMNNDGLLDVVGVGYATNTVSVWYQQAAGGLGAQTPYNVNHTYYEDLAIGDVNDDGLNDIVVTSSNGSPEVAIGVLRQSAGGGFAAAGYYGSSNIMMMPKGCEVGDVNNDGLDDVVVSVGGNGTSANIGVLYQNAGGGLDAMLLTPVYDIPSGVEIADITHDGRNDIVVGHESYSTVGVLRQGSNGLLKPEDRYGAMVDGHNPQSLAVGDINGDGFIDAVVGSSRRLSILINIGL